MTRYIPAGVLLQIALSPVYSDGELPQSVFKKLPRVVNDIPFGPGRLAPTELAGQVRWKYVEGLRALHTFFSEPMTSEDAQETRRQVRLRLTREARAIFGELTVKVTLLLSKCMAIDADVFVNDVAEITQNGMYFSD